MFYDGNLHLSFLVRIDVFSLSRVTSFPLLSSSNQVTSQSLFSLVSLSSFHLLSTCLSSIQESHASFLFLLSSLVFYAALPSISPALTA